nr:3'-5' exonuclease [Pseudomonas sp. dw_358]
MTVSASQRQRLDALPAGDRPGQGELRQQRWVVVDVETTGLNVQRDEVLSIGAVVIEDGAIDFSQPFERTLLHHASHTGPSVLIHGLGPSELAAGTDPAEALLDFLEFVGSCRLLAFHAPFDQRMLARAIKRHLGYRWRAEVLDIAELAPLLLPDKAPREAGLDGWARVFGLQAEERHHAAADAMVTAELMLVLLSHARRQELHTVEELTEHLSQWRRRQNAPGL